MVKSSNIQAKAKETDLSRIQKKLERYERGGYPSRGREDSSTSRQSRAHKLEPVGNSVIPERDEMLEQTGGDYLYMQQQMAGRAQAQQAPKINRTRQQEWEEAVELDRMLEEERKQQSVQRLVQKSEERHN
jgi:hypothetical protein